MSAISPATIESVRVSMETTRTRENQQLGARLGTLSNAIAGGPYIGLLGTVLGIMVVFLGTAMAGDVNINAIAPGMAAALLATAMGLFVAIPALFGYNRLASRNRNVNADMRVFVDEFVTPLVDVLLVVLVIFILTATAQVSGIKVDLPKASSSVSLSQAKTKAISINDVGQVFLDAYPVTLPELEDRLRTEKALNPDFPVIVRGDQVVQYAKVVEVLDLLRRLELSQVGLVTGKPQ
ncbi:MotA/TolQ/ExbB proton channel family protein [Kerstersia gyiorum]